MRNTENLLSIVNLKKYFPMPKSSIFQKERQYLKANEEITLDIRKGETFGLVGESGCGKSTLGRTVLQLYSPTLGEVLYCGVKVWEFRPRYLSEFLRRADYYKSLYERFQENEPFGELLSAARVFGGLLTLPTEKFMENVRVLKNPFIATLEKGNVENEEAEDVWQRLNQEEKNEKFEVYERFRSDGVDLALLTKSELRRLRKEIQIIFQDPYSSLNPRMTVGQIIAEGAATHRFFRKGSKEMNDYVLSVMRSCGLQEYMLHRYPHQFSGGQRQRICIARALAVKPKFVVCDECVSALDVSIQSQILNLLSDLKEREGLTYLFISHDLSVVRYISDRIGVMYLGRIVETGRAEDVFSNPRHPYTIALISAIPSIEEEQNEEKILLKGHMPSPVSPPSGCRFHTRCFMACEKCKVESPPMIEVEQEHFVACHFAKISPKEKKERAYSEQRKGKRAERQEGI